MLPVIKEEKRRKRKKKVKKLTDIKSSPRENVHPPDQWRLSDTLFVQPLSSSLICPLHKDLFVDPVIVRKSSSSIL